MTDPEQDVPRLERIWMEAWRQNDRAACADVLGDDFLLTSARGILMTKSQWLAALDAFKCSAFSWEEMRVRPFGDVALVHARAKQAATVAGQDWSGVFLLTDLWVWRTGRWQVVSRHGTGPLVETKRA